LPNTTIGFFTSFAKNLFSKQLPKLRTKSKDSAAVNKSHRIESSFDQN